MAPRLGGEGEGDAFAAAMERALGVRVAPVPDPPVPRRPLPQEVWSVERQAGNAVVLSGLGASLHVWPTAPMGRGAYATVQWGLWVDGARPLTRSLGQLVAVKAPCREELRRVLDPLTGPSGPSPAQVGQLAWQEARREAALGLAAGAPAAQARLFLTARQAYMLSPPMACHLDEARERLEAGWGHDGSIWGCYVLEEVVPQLRLAHDRGVVHHDLSSSNILLRGGRLYLADFGFGFLLEDQAAQAPHGTAWCAAPETLCAAAPRRPTDPTADFFALGVITLCQAAETPGHELREALLEMVSAPRSAGLRESYQLHFSAWHHGWPEAERATAVGTLFRRLSAALAALKPRLAACLHQLVAPVAEHRARAAATLGPGSLLGGADRERLLARLGQVEMACGAAAARLVRGPLGSSRPVAVGADRPDHGRPPRPPGRRRSVAGQAALAPI